MKLYSGTNSDKLLAAERAALRLKTERAIRLSMAAVEALTPILREAREEEARLMTLWDQAEARQDKAQARALGRDYQQAMAVADAIEACQKVGRKAAEAARGREMDVVSGEYVDAVNRHGK